VGAPPRIETVADGVVRLGTWIVNWYLLEEHGRVTVVDAAVPGYRDQLSPGLAKLGRSDSDVAAVVLTHAHGDHVGVAELLRSELNVPVYIHAGDAELARTGKRVGKNESSVLPYLRHPMAWKLFWELGSNGGSKPVPIKEVQTFADGDELDVPGRPRVVHTPGHTDGHCAFVSGETVFAGDSICELNPLTGSRGPQPMPRAFNRDSEQALRSLDKLVGTGGRLLLPGHGEPIHEPQTAVETAKRVGST
jgi:glyoxylase-like metal-dependent hydrolase (beta-lactamase superfamily II)